MEIRIITCVTHLKSEVYFFKFSIAYKVNHQLEKDWSLSIPVQWTTFHISNSKNWTINNKLKSYLHYLLHLDVDPLVGVDDSLMPLRLQGHTSSLNNALKFGTCPLSIQLPIAKSCINFYPLTQKLCKFHPYSS